MKQIDEMKEEMIIDEIGKILIEELSLLTYFNTCKLKSK